MHPYFVIENSSKINPDFREIWQYRELLFFFSWRDIRVKYKETRLCVAWVILQPLAMTALFSFIRVAPTWQPTTYEFNQQHFCIDFFKKKALLRKNQWKVIRWVSNFHWLSTNCVRATLFFQKGYKSNPAHYPTLFLSFPGWCFGISYPAAWPTPPTAWKWTQRLLRKSTSCYSSSQFRQFWRLSSTWFSDKCW